MKVKKITALLLAGALMASTFAGCGIDKNAVAATYNDKEVTLGFVNFMCRYSQAGVDEMYRGYFGDDAWSQDLYNNGSTMEETMKESIASGIHELYTLRDHMSEVGIELTDAEKQQITEAAKAFMEKNDKKTLNALGATQELVEEMLTLYTIRDKMNAEIIKGADTNVTDEEANMRAYSYIRISYAGEYNNDTQQYEEFDDAKKAELMATAKATAEAVKNGKTLEDAAKDNNLGDVSTSTYAKDDSTLDETFKTALDGLKEGENSELIETESYLYIARIDKDTDEEATAKNKETIIESRQTEYYESKLEEWQKDDNWTMKDGIMDKIVFDCNFNKPATESTESTESTEATTETTTDSTEAATEAATTTEQ